MTRFINVTLATAALLLSTSFAFAADTTASKAANATGAATPPPATTAPAATTKKAAKSATATTKKAAAAKSNPVDINTASEAELAAVPGIGATYASKIVAGRPYANKAQLKSRNILPGTVYDTVKGQIVAKKVKK